MSAIVAERLCKAFPDRRTGRPAPVVANVDLTIENGELVCLVGPSGCGKSTLLNMVAGLARPDSGVLRLPVGRNGDARIAYIFQQPRLLDWVSVRKNVELAVLASGGDPALIDDAIEAVGLADYADAFPSTLSGGQKQRASIARSFATDPDILLLDEPFSALDELTARQLRDLLQKLWLARPRIGLFVTHNTLEAAMLADRVLVFSDRPARLLREFSIDLPRPRSPDDERLFAHHRRIVRSLTGEE